MGKLKKLKYQLKAVRWMEHFKGRVLLADEMGLGKTVEALLWAKAHPKRRPIVIVCPASLKWMWEAFVHDILKVRCDVLQGMKRKLGRPLQESLHSSSCIIVNYDILSTWVPYLKRLNPKILYIDECHYQKNRRAKRTKALQRLAKHIPYIVAISGTPLTNRPAELWTTLHLLRPEEFKSFKVFAWSYCRPKYTPWGWQYKGAHNLRELHRKLKSMMMIRRLKKDVLKELPDKTRTVVPLDIRHRDEYDEAVNNFISWLYKKSASKARRAARAKQLVKMGYLKRLAAKLKMKAVYNWIDSFLEENNGKLVLFCTHTKILNRLHKRYKGQCVAVDGKVKGAKRTAAVATFQTQKRVRIFIGNIRVAGVGITLTAASDLAFVELDWTPGNHTQAEDRIHRIGQKNAANIYYLIAKGTIEESLCELIQKKQKILAATLDGKAKVNQLDIFDELEKALRKGQYHGERKRHHHQT